MFEIRTYDETSSTNDDALRLLGTAEGAGIALVANYQRAGRGRHARAWIAPPGTSLLCTTLLPQPIASSALWAVPFWTALAVADGIEAATGLRVALQWPNDLLLGTAKCCGILCVSRVVGDRAWIGCGTGINVFRPPDAGTYKGIVPPPAFLSDDAAGVERSSVLGALLAAYERRLPEFVSPNDIAAEWEVRAGLDGRRYRLIIDGTHERLEAVARRIAADGSLVVEANGVERTIGLADARVLRD